VDRQRTDPVGGAFNATWEVSRKYDALLAAERAAKGGDHG